MATFSKKQGSVSTATCIVINDAITSSGNTDFSVNQPANTFVEEVYVRVVDAPVISSGDIGFIMGYDSDSTGTTVVNGGTDGLLDGGTTIAAGTIYKISGTAGFALGTMATGDTTSETANASLKVANTLLYGRISATTAASTQGKLEIHVVFRHFH